jgi:hypothetical protein
MKTFLAILLFFGSIAYPQVTINDTNLAYTTGSYSAFLSPYGANGNVFGGTYTESISWSGPLNQTSILEQWNWPASPNCKGNNVCSYLPISFGNADNSTQKYPIAAQQISTITTLKATHSFTLTLTTTGANVIDELYLSSTSAHSRPYSYEITIYDHENAAGITYLNNLYANHAIGTYSSNGITWHVAIDVTANSGAFPDIVFFPSDNSDVPSATIDILAMLNYLVSTGPVTSNLWYAGEAFGVEVINSAGSMTGTFSVAYK